MKVDHFDVNCTFKIYKNRLADRQRQTHRQTGKKSQRLKTQTNDIGVIRESEMVRYRHIDRYVHFLSCIIVGTVFLLFESDKVNFLIDS